MLGIKSHQLLLNSQSANQKHQVFVTDKRLEARGEAASIIRKNSPKGQIILIESYTIVQPVFINHQSLN